MPNPAELTIRRPAALWRLLLAFVVMLATTLQVVPRPCGGHQAGGTCPASASAQCICSCCTVVVAAGRTATDQLPAGTYVERLCGSGGHVLRCIPLDAPPALAHVSLPSWRVPGLWVSPEPVTLTAELPPADLPPASLGHPSRRARTLLRPPDA